MQRKRLSPVFWVSAAFCIAGLAMAPGRARADGTPWSERWSGPNAATVADQGFYLGAGYVRAQINDIAANTGYDYDIDDNAWKLIVGYRPIPFFAVEGNYVNVGHENEGLLGGIPFAHTDARAFDLFGVGLVPLGPIDLFAKAGGARWELSGSFLGPNNSLFDLDTHGVNFAWGTGIQGHYGPIGLRLEYEHFQIPNTGGAKLYTAAVTFTF